jgi:FkbM family methyltransferase
MRKNFYSRREATWIKWLKIEQCFGELNEVALEIFYKKVVQVGDHVIDGGANVGRHTLQLAEIVTNSGLVTAIEPIPSLAANLRHYSNIQVLQVALGKEESHAIFQYVPELSGWSGLQKRKDLSPTYKVELIDVQVCTLDKLFEGVRRPIAFIKLDLEGGEFDALRGARQILITDRPIVVFENSLNYSARLYNYSGEEFQFYFKNSNYTILDFFGNSLSSFDFDQNQPQPWQFVAVPNEKDLREMRRLLRLSCRMAIKELKRTKFTTP